MIDDAREDEQQVGQPVDVPHQDRVDGGRERNHPPLGAAADRPRDVERGAGRGAAGQDEVRQRRQFGLEPIDERFEPRDIGVADERLRQRSGGVPPDRRAGRPARRDRAGSA